MKKCLANFQSILGTKYILERSKNKGKAGHYLEDLLGIKHLPDCLDLEDGEIKAFPLKLKKGKLVPKETVAVTMCNKNNLLNQSFEESNVCKKLSNTLFVPYLWNEKDEIIYYNYFIFTNSHLLWHCVKEDYALIQQKAKEGIMTGSVGKYLQTRTKGKGHGSTSRAFYLRTQFLSEIFGGEFSVAVAK